MLRSIFWTGLVAGFSLIALSTDTYADPLGNSFLKPRMTSIGTTILCPDSIDTAGHVYSYTAAKNGWDSDLIVEMPMHLDLAYPAYINAHHLFCNYVSLDSNGHPNGPRTVLSQLDNGRQCAVRSDKKSFVCRGP